MSKLLANALSNSPFLLIFLKLLKDSNQRFPFILAQNCHNFRYMLDHSQLDLIVLILEEIVHNFEQIFFSQTLSKKFSYLMDAFTHSLLDLFIVKLQQFFIYLPQVTFPSLFAYCVEHCREVIGAAVYYFILFTQIVYVIICHLTILFEQLLIELQPLQLEDKRPKVFICRYPHPLIAIFQETQHRVC